MSLDNFLKNLTSATAKMKDYVDNETGKQKTTIMHPEVYSTIEDARKASEDLGFKTFFSTKKEFNRRLKGI